MQLDSFELWRQICSNKLLCSAHLIIMLNKCDILDTKLKAGLQFARFVTSYKDANDFEHVSKCMAGVYLDVVMGNADYNEFIIDLKSKFISLHQLLTPPMPNSRRLYTHLTCATVRSCDDLD